MYNRYFGGDDDYVPLPPPALPPPTFLPHGGVRPLRPDELGMSPHGSDFGCGNIFGAGAHRGGGGGHHSGGHHGGKHRHHHRQQQQDGGGGGGGGDAGPSPDDSSQDDDGGDDMDFGYELRKFGRSSASSDFGVMAPPPPIPYSNVPSGSPYANIAQPSNMPAPPIPYSNVPPRGMGMGIGNFLGGGGGGGFGPPQGFDRRHHHHFRKFG